MMRPPIVLAGLLLVAACAPEAERVVLADIHPESQTTDPVYGKIVIRPMGLHRFGEGWLEPGEDAVLQREKEASLELALLGRDHRFTMVYSSHPKLVARNIRGTIHLNGTEVATLQPKERWVLDTLTVVLPADAVVKGVNRVAITTTERLGDADGESLHWSLYVKRITVDGLLGGRDRERWDRWSGRDLSPVQEAVTIPGEPDPGAERPDPGPGAPDVVMILLDALQADRAGAWGYHRDTTPNIDRLAREGVALTNVFAEAPYTRSSVATLLSAHSWRDHQVLGRGHALGRHFTTLAELLQESGWATLAITDNPNVARSAGSDQGFDRFVEAWTDEPVEAFAPGGWWPERPVLIWERLLGEGLDPDRPVFAYLHLLPPHDPYLPGAEHDRFGPEGYDGPVTGTGPDIVAFDEGRFGEDPADQARLEALYDGGLRRGDALLARALRAWDALDRDRPRLLVVLSDHGEAFGEHGRYGHNTSVHREMTHVPVVLHPRELVAGSVAGSPGALRSLGDLLPLLVHSLGLRLPAGTTWPSRVIEVLEDPARPRDELFIRCGTPRFGRRTAGGLWVFQAGRAQAWFDLEQDPAAQVNQLTARTEEWFAGLAALRTFLASSVNGMGAVPAELSDEDRERLEALGYTGGR